MSQPDDIVPKLRVMQTIAALMPLGVIVFAALLLTGVVEGQAPPQPPALPLISIVAIVVLAGAIPLSFLFPTFQTRSAVRAIAAGTWTLPEGDDAKAMSTDVDKLMAVRQTSSIISLAVLEGAGFIGCVAYLLESHPIALGVVLTSVLMMYVHFPTEPRVRTWLKWQLDDIEELRRSAGNTSKRV